LQSQLDPNLFSARYAAEQKLLDTINGPDQGQEVANQLMAEIGTEDPSITLVKQKLLDSAIDELDAGASLPPDVQAELVKAGLERAGTIGAGSNSRGLAGQETRRLIGKEALELKKTRQNQAMSMTDAADTLANRRYQLLAGVFPNLKALQTENINQSSKVMGLSEEMLPEAGLSGTNLVNLLMARVGASNALTAQGGDAMANLGKALGTAYGNMYGGIAGAASSVDWGGAAKNVWGKMGGTAGTTEEKKA
jgi:hypothetical protein